MRFILRNPNGVFYVAQIDSGEVREAFARIAWEHDPVSSGELVKNCEKGAVPEEAGVTAEPVIFEV